LQKLGEKTIWIDCDVIQADGGTRTASITGAFVAMALALGKMVENKKLPMLPITDFLAATSVGIDEEHGIILDLNYIEDSKAHVDMNIVMTGSGRFVEIQGTGEEATFSYEQLLDLLTVAEKGIYELIALQKEALGSLAEQIVQNRSEGEETK
jgi:ribonuclease PH